MQQNEFQNVVSEMEAILSQIQSIIYTLGKKGCYTPGWCVFFVIISISSVREV